MALTVQNTGQLPGKEVVQLYTEKVNSAIDRPLQELKAFTKTRSLEPEAVDSLWLCIPVKELRYWDENKNDWTLEQGIYNVKVGASSRDIRQSAEVDLQ